MLNQDNLVLATDSYKLTHWKQYPENTETVYSYFESRVGAEYPATLFFGLQHIIKQFLLKPITGQDIVEAYELAKIHFGTDTVFNGDGWEHILWKHEGLLPLRIKAVPEGSVIPIGNVLMTVENTDPECYWLTNAMESLLTHVWYPSTVATRSYFARQIIRESLERTGDSLGGLDFMLQDFGYRGATTHDAAALGGAGHLVNFKGTDTLPALILAINSYAADPQTLGFSVPATEHSVMTSMGRDGEMGLVRKHLDEFPTGILSEVGDSFDIHHFVNEVTVGEFRNIIEARDGVFVIRPDSLTQAEKTPGELVRWIAKTVDFNMGHTVNSKGFKVINDKVRILWGDGIDLHGIEEILDTLEKAGYSAENIACFGMGGGLLQKVNRDTQRSAFKSSAQKRNGEWHDVSKKPLDESKTSKAGRLDLFRGVSGQYKTVREPGPNDEVVNGELVLETVFENGQLVRDQTFDDIRERAAQYTAVPV